MVNSVSGSSITCMHASRTGQCEGTDECYDVGGTVSAPALAPRMIPDLRSGPAAKGLDGISIQGTGRAATIAQEACDESCERRMIISSSMRYFLFSLQVWHDVLDHNIGKDPKREGERVFSMLSDELSWAVPTLFSYSSSATRWQCVKMDLLH